MDKILTHYDHGEGIVNADRYERFGNGCLSLLQTAFGKSYKVSLVKDKQKMVENPRSSISRIIAIAASILLLPALPLVAGLGAIAYRFSSSRALPTLHDEYIQTHSIKKNLISEKREEEILNIVHAQLKELLNKEKRFHIYHYNSESSQLHEYFKITEENDLDDLSSVLAGKYIDLLNGLEVPDSREKIYSFPELFEKLGPEMIELFKTFGDVDVFEPLTDEEKELLNLSNRGPKLKFNTLGELELKCLAKELLHHILSDLKAREEIFDFRYGPGQHDTLQIKF